MTDLALAVLNGEIAFDNLRSSGPTQGRHEFHRSRSLKRVPCHRLGIERATVHQDVIEQIEAGVEIFYPRIA